MERLVEPRQTGVRDMRLSCSVVIPVFNRGDQLAAVLEGLCHQSLATDMFEVLVCDDGSTDPLEGVIGQFHPRFSHLKHLRQPNGGPASARNLGIRHAVSPLVVFLDSDVLPDSRMLESLVAALDINDNWLGAEAKLVPTGPESGPGWDAPHTSHGGAYHTAAIAYRRSTLEAVGGLDENFRLAACEDVELAAQVLKRGPIGFVSEAIAYHPRRRRTLAATWRARKHWKYVYWLAERERFLGWPGRPTHHPRLRTAICATLTLPVGRLISALRHVTIDPGECVRAVLLSLVAWVAGVFVLPTILLSQAPERRDFLHTTADQGGVTV